MDQMQLSEKEIAVVRGLVPRKDRKKDKEPVWGLFPESGLRLNWKIPDQQIVTEAVDFIPNSILIQGLLPAFAPYYDWAKELLALGEKAREADKVKAILQPLPLPVSEQLRKLMSPEQIGSEHDFFQSG